MNHLSFRRTLTTTTTKSFSSSSSSSNTTNKNRITKTPHYFHKTPPPNLLKFAQNTERLTQIAVHARKLFLDLVINPTHQNGVLTIAKKEQSILALDRYQPLSQFSSLSSSSLKTNNNILQQHHHHQSLPNSTTPNSQSLPTSTILSKRLPPAQYRQNALLLHRLNTNTALVHYNYPLKRSTIPQSTGVTTTTTTTTNNDAPRKQLANQAWKTLTQYNHELGTYLDLSTYNKAFILCAERRDGEGALRLYENIKRELGEESLPAVYHTLMYALSSSVGTYQHALGIYERMKKEGLAPTKRTLNGVLLSCRQIGRGGGGELALQYWNEIVHEASVKPDMACYTNLLMCFGRENQVWRQGPISDNDLRIMDISWPRNPPLLAGTGDEVGDIISELKLQMGDGDDFYSSKNEIDNNQDSFLQEQQSLSEEEEEDTGLSPGQVQELNIWRAEQVYQSLIDIANNQQLITIDTAFLNALTYVYASALRLARARNCLQLFDKHNCIPNSRTFSILIEMFARASRLKSCEEMIHLAKMKYGITILDKDAYGAHIACAARNSGVEYALQLYEKYQILLGQDEKFLERHIRHLRQQIEKSATTTDNNHELMVKIPPNPNAWRLPEVVSQHIKTIQGNRKLRFEELQFRAKLRK
jgi:hypothetical protein